MADSLSSLIENHRQSSLGQPKLTAKAPDQSWSLQHSCPALSFTVLISPLSLFDIPKYIIHYNRSTWRKLLLGVSPHAVRVFTADPNREKEEEEK